jgi:hypothetical protein
MLHENAHIFYLLNRISINFSFLLKFLDFSFERKFLAHKVEISQIYSQINSLYIYCIFQKYPNSQTEKARTQSEY